MLIRGRQRSNETMIETSKEYPLCTPTGPAAPHEQARPAIEQAANAGEE
jgi:hypothetical protein